MHAEGLEEAYERWSRPAAALRPIGFWFLNDDLSPEVVRAQLTSFAAAGYGGVVLHPRIGLPSTTGYLTAGWFALVRQAAEVCCDLGLQVLLYDEASYPSGSANGAVVAADPRHAAHCLQRVVEGRRGPCDGYWRPSVGRALDAELVVAVAGRVVGGRIDPSTVRPLVADELGVTRVVLGEGEWRLEACFVRPSGGTIRGAFDHQDDGSATAPPAGDVLSPDAVASFLRLTHDAYARELGDLFGTTVTGFFTDEPSPLGRAPRTGAKAWTSGLEHDLAAALGVDVETLLPVLPLLWEDGAEAERLQAAHERVVHARLRDVLFGQMRAWCTEHGLALTGHPDLSNDMACLQPFHWPGQDVVWRWVLPGESARTGPHSTSALAAASAARLWGRERTMTELFGAYGWELSLDEVKFLLDWHAVRGTDLFVVHALFASLRGGRAWESQPDLGPAHPAWEHLATLVRHAGRLSAVQVGAVAPASVGVVGDGHALPWAAATWLLEHQVPVHYLPAQELQNARLVEGELVVGEHRWTALVVDEAPGQPPLPPGTETELARLGAGGAQVLRHSGSGQGLEELAADDVTVLDGRRADLRLLRRSHGELQLVLLSNEGEQQLSVRLGGTGDLRGEWWDPMTGARHEAPVEPDGTRALTLARRGSVVLALGPGTPVPAVPEQPAGREEPLELGPWASAVVDDGRPGPAVGDWSRQAGWERFSGSVRFTASLDVPEGTCGLAVDLGVVGESAVVELDGVPVGAALWAPYRVVVPEEHVRPGVRTLGVVVTCSPANRYEGAQRPAGLLDRVTVVCKRLQSG